MINMCDFVVVKRLYNLSDCFLNCPFHFKYCAEICTSSGDASI